MNSDDMAGGKRERADANQLNGGVPEQCNRLSDDPMDWPLPCDVTVGHGTIRKGCSLRTLVLRMEVLYRMSRNRSSGAALTAKQRGLIDEAIQSAEFEGHDELAKGLREEFFLGHPLVAESGLQPPNALLTK